MGRAQGSKQEEEVEEEEEEEEERFYSPFGGNGAYAIFILFGAVRFARFLR